jgi:hypothetical protein
MLQVGLVRAGRGDLFDRDTLVVEVCGVRFRV